MPTEQKKRIKREPEIAHVEMRYWDRRRVDRRVVKVDRVVWEHASKYAWFLLGGSGKGKAYCCTGDIHAPVYLHRYAWQMLHGNVEIPKDMCIDHISGNNFDCTCDNLRCVTYSENRMNSEKGIYKRGPCTSEHKGVWKRTHKRKSGEIVTSYVGEVHVQGHPKRTKSFSATKYADPEREAALWYNRQVSELVSGGIARLNQVGVGPDDDNRDDSSENQHTTTDEGTQSDT